MEACGGANYWARKFKAYGNEVKLISPQFVKPFVKGNKNDYKDAGYMNAIFIFKLLNRENPSQMG